jgi:signal transduction histidine kinase
VLATERLAAVGQTVATLVHSLKNMLSGLKGGAYMVGKGLADGQRELADQGLAMLGRNMARVGRLVKDLLTLSKPREPELMPVDLKDLCAEAVATMQAEAEAQDVVLACLPCLGQPRANVEHQAVLDAMLNLIGNAIDSAGQMPAGRVEVRITSLEGQACLEVSDNGSGLEPEAQERIFQGFYSTKGASGTGLGLMVCQKTAKEHGGRLEFSSLPGQGARFRLILPLTSAQPGRNVPADGLINLIGQAPGASDRGKER